MKSAIIVLLSLLTISSGDDDKWTGKWFPNDPNLASTTEKSVINATSQGWSGKWFPENPSKLDSSLNFENDRIMGIPNADCDDGITNLGNDFDPHSFDHSLNYMCLESPYKPNYDVEPIQTIYDVPKFYTPVHKCMNESITYAGDRIPTLGYHRPLWAAFGEYTYLPPQRWLHNLEHGSIVALYHPCSNKVQIEKLKRIVKRCLRRHVITPYKKLSSERPFALAAWGTSLEFNVINEMELIDFIKKYAKTGPEKVSRDGQYKLLLTEAAKIISDIDDSEVCPKVNGMM